MGILDRLRQQGAADNLDIRLAIMTILSACIQYDGEIGDNELRKLRSILAWSPLFASNSTEEDDKIIEAADALINQMGMNGAIDAAVRSLPNHLRTTAICFAFDLVHSDGDVADDEKEFLTVLANKAELPPHILDAIDLVTCAKYANG